MMLVLLLKSEHHFCDSLHSGLVFDPFAFLKNAPYPCEENQKGLSAGYSFF